MSANALTPPNKAATPPKRPNIPLNQIGFFIDGWADLVENGNEHTSKVQEEVYQILTSRNMPDVEVKRATGSVGMLSFDTSRRDYTITTTHPGATTTVYIAPHGNDLYVSWATYIRPILNKKLFLILLAIAVGPGLCVILSAFAGSLTNIGRSLSESPIGGAGTLVGTLVTLACCGGFVLYVILAIFAFETVVVGMASYFVKGNAITFFLIEPSVFDADDIAAMSLSVHKSILKALDKIGIDTSHLRLKQQFKRGRGTADTV